MGDRIGPGGVSDLPEPGIFDFGPVPFEPGEMNANGDEELYDHASDPNEFHNLANDPENAPVIEKLATYLPAREVPSGPRLPRQKYTQEFDWTKPSARAPSAPEIGDQSDTGILARSERPRSGRTGAQR